VFLRLKSVIIRLTEKVTGFIYINNFIKLIFRRLK